MKKFVIHVSYHVALSRIEELTPDHRAYLQRFYESGNLLFSGPRVPRTGGVIVGKFDSIPDVEQFVRNDPFYKNQVAEYEIIEFDPVKFQDSVKSWL